MVKNRWPILVFFAAFLFVLGPSFAYSTSINPLTKPFADTLYCGLSTGCGLNITELFPNVTNNSLHLNQDNWFFDDWILYNSSSYTFLFNESQLDTTYFNATKSAAIYGTISGVIDYTQHKDGNYDGITLNITEVAGSPALDVRLNFTDVSGFNQGIMRYKTSVLTGDYPIIQVWDYNESSWEDYPSVSSSSTFVIITEPVFDSVHHLNNSVVQMRIYKASNGNTNNKYYIDWVAVSKGFGSLSGTSIDLSGFVPYSGASQNVDIGQYNLSVSSLQVSIADKSLNVSNLLFANSTQVIIGNYTNPTTKLFTINQLADSNAMIINGYDDESPNNAQLYLSSAGDTYFTATGRIYLEPTDDFILSITNTNYLTIRDRSDNSQIYMTGTTGNIGIDTTTPLHLIQIHGNTSNATINISQTASINMSGTLFVNNYNSTSNSFIVGRDLNFNVSSQGNVQVGGIFEVKNGSVLWGNTRLRSLPLDAGRIVSGAANNEGYLTLYNSSNSDLTIQHTHSSAGRIKFQNRTGDNVFQIETRTKRLGLGMEGANPSKMVQFAASGIQLINFTDDGSFELANKSFFGGNATFLRNISAIAIYGNAIAAGSPTVSIDADGNLGVIPSSGLTKKNIKNVTSTESSWIYNLTPIKFDYINSALGTNQLGMIAEDVQKINSNVVFNKYIKIPYNKTVNVSVCHQELQYCDVNPEIVCKEYDYIPYNKTVNVSVCDTEFQYCQVHEENVIDYFAVEREVVCPDDFCEVNVCEVHKETITDYYTVDSGEPEGINYASPYMITALISVVQQQKKEIDSLKKELCVKQGIGCI